MLPDETAPRSRRAILSAAAGGLAGLLAGALGRPGPTNAAAGDSLKLGQVNDSGTAQTVLTNAGLGAAFTLKTTNTATNAAGIFGWSSSIQPGVTRGVYGKADGPNSLGVHARQTGPAGTGAAVYAEGNNNHGLVAITGSPSSDAVKGITTSSEDSAVAVHGLVASTSSGVDATAVRGENRGTGTQGIGVYGTHAGGGVGVFGSAADGGAGLYGFTASGYGVIGGTSTGVGVHGSSNTGIGVRGTSVSWYAGYFDGDVGVNGTLTKSAGAFKIDHPLDPTRKYLNHSFVESPDMLNVYSGTATLDAKGNATIGLPGYFDALNRDVRYQLTPIGGPAPDLHVRSGVANGRFRIAGGTAGQEVSWQITGIRKDPYAEAHRIVVEEAKPKADRGLYLNPELFGQPKEKGLDWRDRPPEIPARRS
jgi:hypothetical protein